MTFPNVHPIVVHFPVAMLTVYAMLELARLKFVTSRSYVFYVKAAFLAVGTLGAIAAYLTGDRIEHMFAGDAALMHQVETHSRWAIATIVTFGTLAVGYLLAFVGREAPQLLTTHPAFKSVHDVAARLIASPLAALVALVGLACVTITGALGGGLVYGNDIDPMVELVTTFLL